MKRLHVAVVAILLRRRFPLPRAGPLPHRRAPRGIRTCRSRTSSPAPRRRAAAIPMPPGSRVPLAGTCRDGSVQREPLRVVAGGQARYRGPRRHVEVLLRQVLDLLHVLPRRATRSWAGRRRATTRSRATTASRPARRTCRRAGPTRPTRTSDFDTKGRVYQTMLPFNSFFDATKLHPDGEIDMSYSDDLGRHWVKGNGGVPLEAAEQRLGQAARPRRGQAVGRRQPHRRQPVPGSRLRGLGGLQRQRRRDQGADGGLP